MTMLPQPKLTSSKIGYAIILACFGPSLPSWTQDWPTNGLYQIVSGRYTECCGIGGSLSYQLPNHNQGFIQLSVDPETFLARMSILGPGMGTVFQIPAFPPTT